MTSTLSNKKIDFPDVEEPLDRYLRTATKHYHYSSEDTLFRGNPVIVNLFFLYLMKKYLKSICIITFMKTETIEPSDRFYFGLHFQLKKGVVTDNSLFNFQILSRNFVECLQKKNNPIILVPISISIIDKNGQKVGHSNMLLYRRFNNTIEHYEPHGEALRVSGQNGRKGIEKLIKLFVEEINKNLEKEEHVLLVPSEDTCPNLPNLKGIGLQGLENIQEEKIGNCMTWSFFMFEMCLLNPEFTSREIQNSVLNSLARQTGYKEDDTIDSEYYNHTLPHYLIQLILGYAVIMNEKVIKYFSKIFNDDINKDNLRNPHKKVEFTKKTNEFISLLLYYDTRPDEEIRNDIKVLKLKIKKNNQKKPSNEFDIFRKDNEIQFLTQQKKHLETVRKLKKAKDSDSLKIDSKTKFSSNVSSFNSEPRSNSPGYGPNSPGYGPNSPGYGPNSPGNAYNSPDYSKTSPGYAPDSPEYSKTSPAPRNGGNNKSRKKTRLRYGKTIKNKNKYRNFNF